ncbi:hypothetical protein [Labilibaculum euxinus]
MRSCFQRQCLFIVMMLVGVTGFSQSKDGKIKHKTIIETDYSFKLFQSAKDEFNQSVRVINPADNYIGFRYTNAFFIKEDLSIGIGIGLEGAPVLEIPVVFDVRKYFGEKENRNYTVFNVGKTFNGYSEFKTWLGEIGFGRNYKIIKKISLNIGVHYQLTYLKKGIINNDDHRDWVRDFYTGSLAIKIGFIF